MPFSFQYITETKKPRSRNRYRRLPAELEPFFSGKSIDENNHISDLTGIPHWVIVLIVYSRPIGAICTVFPLVSFAEGNEGNWFYRIAIIALLILTIYALPRLLWRIAWIKYGKKETPPTAP